MLQNAKSETRKIQNAIRQANLIYKLLVKQTKAPSIEQRISSAYTNSK